MTAHDQGGGRLGFAASYAALARARKGAAAGAPAYSVFVNRPLGRVAAAAANAIGLGPDLVTVVSAISTFAGLVVVAVAPWEPLTGVVVAVLLVLGYALDSADGQVARLRGGGSLAGEWLDHVVDAAKTVSLHVAVAIGLFRLPTPDERLLLVPLAFAIVGVTTFFAMILNDLLRRGAGVAEAASSGGGPGLRSLLVLPTDYGVLCLSFLLLGIPAAFVVVYSALGLAAAVFLVAALFRWRRSMVAIDRARVSA